jgi:DNA modification methylase
MTKHTLFIGDCIEAMKKIEDESVHTIVTSPPYYNAKDYDNEGNNLGEHDSYEEYLESMRKVIQGCKRILVPGGKICWNTSPVLEDGKRIGVPFDTNTIFIEEGFDLDEDIVWKKPDGAAKLRCGGWCQNKGKPMTWHANIATEYIMVYTKPGKREAGEFEPITKFYTEGIPKDLLTNVWMFNPETNEKGHPAPYPYELVKRCILLYSFVGDTIFEPFAGTGTTMKVAKDLKRNSIGCELSKVYVERIQSKVGFKQKNLFEQDEFIIEEV